jgi:hypothetical protein
VTFSELAGVDKVLAHGTHNLDGKKVIILLDGNVKCGQRQNNVDLLTNLVRRDLGKWSRKKDEDNTKKWHKKTDWGIKLNMA